VITLGRLTERTALDDWRATHDRAKEDGQGPDPFCPICREEIGVEAHNQLQRETISKQLGSSVEREFRSRWGWRGGI